MALQRLFYRLGCVGLASLFVLGALNKIVGYTDMRIRMAEAGLEPAGLLLPIVIALEGIGGLLVACGVRYAWLAAGALALHTLATNAVFHRFWELSGEIAALELSLFFKNVSIAGALVAIAAVEWHKAPSA